MDSSNPTINVRQGEEIDPEQLDAVLKRVVPGLQGTPSIKQFPSGASNLTYLIGYDNRELVLRRPPPGIKAASAHSMIREYRVISALEKEYPAVLPHGQNQWGVGQRQNPCTVELYSGRSQSV